MIPRLADIFPVAGATIDDETGEINVNDATAFIRHRLALKYVM